MTDPGKITFMALVTLLISMVNPAEGRMAEKASIVTVTAFTLSRGECGGRVKKTALMTKPRPGRTAATSRDNLQYLGHHVYVEGFGVWKIESLMAKGITKSIDLLVPTKHRANKIGRSKRRIVVI